MPGKKQKDSDPAWSHKNDYPIEEVWNTDNTLAQLIAPRSLATHHPLNSTMVLTSLPMQSAMTMVSAAGW